MNAAYETVWHELQRNKRDKTDMVNRIRHGDGPWLTYQRSDVLSHTCMFYKREQLRLYK